MSVRFLPTFDLACNVWWGWTIAATYPAAAPDLVSACNLQFAPKVSTVVYPFGQGITPWLLLPAGTNVRSPVCYGISTNKLDVVEVPAGSGRKYVISDVDDVSKGFTTEYRVASLCKAPFVANPLPTWPVPIP